MRKKLSVWQIPRGRARADALDIISEHGQLAAEVAKRLARGDGHGRPPVVWLPRGYWDRVAREVRRAGIETVRSTDGEGPINASADLDARSRSEVEQG